VISGAPGCLLWLVTAGGVLAEADTVVRLEGLLAQALEANKQLTALAERQQAEIVGLRASLAARDAELERVNAELTVLKRMLFGRSSERARPATADSGCDHSGDDHSGDGDAGGRPAGGTSAKRGPGARAGRRDYSHLPRVEMVWDFPDGEYCCPQCQTPFHRLGDYVTEVLDWVVTVRVAAHCRRRYRRVCSCRVPATVTAPGPPKAIGKGLVSNAFIAHLLTERYVAGRSQNSLVTGLARHGADLSAATLTGTCAATGELLAPLEVAIVARSRGSWHLHADETGWRVFTPREDTPDGKDAVAGPVKWWLWVFLGPDTACFVMDPTRSGAVLARHAGIDQVTGQLVEHPDTGQDAGAGSDAGADSDAGAGADQAEGPRQLVISSDFYSVYSSAGRKASGLVNLYCWAHVRRYFVRAGDANPDQLAGWTAAWLTRIKNLYLAHEQLSAAWADGLTGGATSGAAGLEQARTAWDEALGVIDTARTKQMASPGLQAPARKALATLDREWDGLVAHRDYPMIGLDNNPAERALRRPVVTRKNAYGSRTEAAARLAARVWTVTATAEMAGLNPITYLTAYLNTCGRAGGKPLAGPDLERFLPWAATPDDLHAWKQPPRPG
jgi:transposase